MGIFKSPRNRRCFELLELSCDFAAIFAWITKTLSWWTPQGKFVSPFFPFPRSNPLLKKYEMNIAAKLQPNRREIAIKLPVIYTRNRRKNRLCKRVFS